MDQERWNWAQTFLQLSSFPDSTSTMSQPRSSNEISRYKSDIEQALAMKADKTRVRSANITTEDVVLGLNGLDQALLHQQNKQLKSALKLYELSLELLIKCLGRDVSVDLPIGLSRATIETRVHEALSDAEAIKIALKEQSTAESTRESPNNASTKDVSATVSNAIATALQRVNRNSVDAKGTRPHASNFASSRPSAVRVATKAPDTRKVVSPATPKRRPEIGSTGVDTASSLSDLHQTILRDFYISPGSLEKTSWDDIAGLQDVKQSLQEAAILPLIRPDLFTGLRKPRNILLYGPPGTGKTMLVKAVANESQSNLFIVTSSALTSKWMGEAEKLVKSLFEVAHASAPSIVFIDEMDALLSARKSDGEHEASRRLKTEFMVQIDGIIQQQQTSNANVLLLGCTNCPWDVDSAVMRRFPRRIYVPLPDSDARNALLQYLLKHKMGKHSINTRQITAIVRRTEGFSCSDIQAVASEAAFGPIRSLSVAAIRSTKKGDIRPVDISDFDQAISSTTKSVSPSLLKKYNVWHTQQQAAS